MLQVKDPDVNRKKQHETNSGQGDSSVKSIAQRYFINCSQREENRLSNSVKKGRHREAEILAFVFSSAEILLNFCRLITPR